MGSEESAGSPPDREDLLRLANPPRRRVDVYLHKQQLRVLGRCEEPLQ